MTLGKRITALRVEQHLSQEKLAEQMQVSRQSVSKWELDQATPDVEYIIRLSELFCVTTDYLLKGTPSIEKKALVEEPAQEIKDTPRDASPAKSGSRHVFVVGICLFLIGGIGLLAFWIVTLINPYLPIEGMTIIVPLMCFGMALSGLFCMVYNRVKRWQRKTKLIIIGVVVVLILAWLLVSMPGAVKYS